MPITIKYPKNPNIDTAFVEQDDGTKNRALMIAPQDISTLELPNNPNSTKGYVTVDGKKQRVILTADITGGGGGGTVDKSKIVNADTIPTASASNAGYVYLYTGTTNASYTHGYVYQNVKSATYTGTVSFEAATLSGTTVACSGDNFATFLTEAGADPTPIVSGTMTYEADATGWRLVGKDSDGNTVTTFMEYVEDYQDAGFTFTGTPQDGDVIAFTCSVTEASATYTWTRIDVQPQASGLPDQTGHSGEFLTTDGTDASWGIAYSFNSYSATWGTATGSYAIGLGDDSQATGTKAVAIGQDARGNGSMALALGYGARVTANNAIQLNASGVRTNSDASTFKVGNVYGNFEIMSADGTIPTARFTTDPVSDGTYYPTLTISSGTPTRSWSTIAALQNTTTNTNSLAILGSAYDSSCINSVTIGKDAVVYSQDTVTIGYNSYANGQYGVAVGKGAQSFRNGAIALGNGARAGDTQSIAIGYSSSVSDANSAGSVVIGSGSATNGAGTVAIGSSAKTQAHGCIQLGDGTNTETGTFCVATKTAQYGTPTNYKLMDSDGTIPAARHAALPAADGTYTLQLVITDGVPTLSWVSE